MVYLQAVTDFLNQRFSLLGATALAILVFAITNLPWNLDEYDQAKQAFTSYEMVTQGHWFYQHTPSGWVATKPPLVGWSAAALFALTHSWEWSWRLPSFLSCLVLLLLLIRATGSYGREAALVVACAFSFNLLTPRLATLVRTDMPLALIIFVLGKMIWDRIRNQRAWGTTDRTLFCVFLIIGLFIKGPILYAFLLPGILLFQLRVRITGEPVSAWCGWWPWLVSIGLFLVWVIGGILLVPGFLDNVVIREFMGRFGGAVHRAQPVYFYLPHLLHRFAPWSLLLMLLGWLGWKKKQDGGWRGWLSTISPETFWLIVWSLGGLLVMSLLPSKRVDRIYPIVPPLCLLLGAQIGRATETWKSLSEKACAIAVVVAVVITTCYATGKLITGYYRHTDELAKFGKAVRSEAATHNLRYKVVGGEDEGMLLYLRQPGFVDEEQAVAEWNNGQLDALILPGDKVDELLARLPGAVPSTIGQSATKRRYLLISRP